MLVRSWVSPRREGASLTCAPAKPRTLVLCKASREVPSLHPSVRRLLESDPKLARLVEENPRLLRKLQQQSANRLQSGRKQAAQNKGPPLETLYVSLIVEATSGEAAALLRAAMNQEAADLVIVTAVFDRLRALHAVSRPGSREDLQAAFQLALQEALRRLPEATPRTLAALARAAYYLRQPVPQEEHQRIVGKFVSLMRAMQSAPAPKPGPPPPKQGWVTLKLAKQRSIVAPATADVPDCEETNGIIRDDSSSRSFPGSSSWSIGSSSGSQRGSQVQAAECRVGRELEQDNRNLSNFVWAILSNSQWQLPDEQLAALMECVRLQPVTLPQHHTIVLVGLMRYADFKGVAAVRPYVEEGGTSEVVLNRLLSQLATLDRQACSETLISVGRLRICCSQSSLAALFRCGLEAFEDAAPQPTVTDGRDRLLGIAKLFFGLSCCTPDLLPQLGCQAALALPAARDLAEEFAEHAMGPKEYELWADMLIACCQLGFNPPVGSQQGPPLTMLLRHLPSMRTRFAFFTSLEILLSLGHVYGLPAGGQAAPELRPYHKSLVHMARGCQKLFDQYSGQPLLEDWCTARRLVAGDFPHVLQAYV